MVQIAELLTIARRRVGGQSLTLHAGMLASAQYLSAALGLLTIVVVTRWLGPEQYGVSVLAMAYPSLLWSFLSFKPISIATRYIASFRAEDRRTELLGVYKLSYFLDVGVSGVVVLFVALTGPWVARNIYGQPELAPWMLLFAASFPCYALTGTGQAVLIVWRRFDWLALLQVGEQVLLLMLIVLSFVFDVGPIGYIASATIAATLSGLTTASLATWLLGRQGFADWWRTPLSVVAALRADLTRLFGWNYLGVTMSGIALHIPLVILGRVRGAEDVAFLRLATTLTTAATYPAGALAKVVYPTLSELLNSASSHTYGSMLRRWSMREGAAGCVAVLLGGAALPYIVPLVFGPSYVPMVPGVQALLSSVAVATVCFWINPLAYARGEVGRLTLVVSIQSACVIVGVLATAPSGFFAVAVVISVAQAGALAYQVWWALRQER